eukprot:UN31698
MARLKKSAEKAKEILSANKDTTVRITSLIEDFDFKSVITRDQFEHLGSELFQRSMLPLDQVLERSNLEKEDVDGIVLMGGASRIPKFHDLLTKYLNKDIRKDLNTDEAAAFGSVFRAANMSTTFRVRQIGFTDRCFLWC